MPTVLNFDSVLDKMVEIYQSPDFQKSKSTLHNLISTAEDEMNHVIEIIFDHVATSFYMSLRGKIHDYYRYEKLEKNKSSNVRK